MDLGPSACEAIPLSRMGSVSLQSAGIQKLSTGGVWYVRIENWNEYFVSIPIS